MTTTELTLGDLYLELETGRHLVVQHVSDDVLNGKEAYYVNDMDGNAAGMITPEDAADGTRYRLVGRIDEPTWREALAKYMAHLRGAAISQKQANAITVLRQLIASGHFERATATETVRRWLVNWGVPLSEAELTAALQSLTDEGLIYAIDGDWHATPTSPTGRLPTPPNAAFPRTRPSTDKAGPLSNIDYSELEMRMLAMAWPGSAPEPARNLLGARDAYIIGAIDPATRTLAHVSIHSEDASSITHNRRYALVDMGKTWGLTFAQAADAAVDMLKSEAFDWLGPLREAAFVRTGRWKAEAPNIANAIKPHHTEKVVTFNRAAEPGWIQVTPFDKAGRRALWMRPIEGNPMRLQICAGREGDDYFTEFHGKFASELFELFDAVKYGYDIANELGERSDLRAIIADARKAGREIVTMLREATDRLDAVLTTDEATRTLPDISAAVEWAWARKGDEHANGPFPTRKAAIEDAKANGADAPEVGTIRWAMGPDFVPSAEDIVAQMNERAYDDEFHWDGGDIFETTPEARVELDAFLDGWARRHVGRGNCWIIEKEETPE